MPPGRKADAALLLDMLTAARAVQRYVHGQVRADLDTNEMLRDAQERRIEVIGEAARTVSEAFRDLHPEIPRKKITATRHILAHDYGDVDHNILWRIPTVHVAELATMLEPLIPPIPPDPEPSES